MNNILFWQFMVWFGKFLVPLINLLCWTYYVQNTSFSTHSYYHFGCHLYLHMSHVYSQHCFLFLHRFLIFYSILFIMALNMFFSSIFFSVNSVMRNVYFSFIILFYCQFKIISLNCSLIAIMQFTSSINLILLYLGNVCFFWGVKYKLLLTSNYEDFFLSDFL